MSSNLCLSGSPMSTKHWYIKGRHEIISNFKLIINPMYSNCAPSKTTILKLCELRPKFDDYLSKLSSDFILTINVYDRFLSLIIARRYILIYFINKHFNQLYVEKL